MANDKGIFGSDVESLATLQATVDRLVADLVQALDGATITIAWPALANPIVITIGNLTAPATPPVTS